MQLLRVAKGWVFFAPDSIAPGTDWMREIEKAIEECKLMVVFWCAHSKESKWVRNEYLTAIKLDKGIVPVVLDNTPVPDELGKFQGIDFRGVLADHEGDHGSLPSSFKNADSFLGGREFESDKYYQNLRASSFGRNAWLSLIGLFLTILVLWRPFPSPFESDAVTIFNIIVGVVGFFLWFQGLRKSKQDKSKLEALKLKTGKEQEKLAAALGILLERLSNHD